MLFLDSCSFSFRILVNFLSVFSVIFFGIFGHFFRIFDHFLSGFLLIFYPEFRSFSFLIVNFLFWLLIFFSDFRSFFSGFSITFYPDYRSFSIRNLCQFSWLLIFSFWILGHFSLRILCHFLSRFSVICFKILGNFFPVSLSFFSGFLVIFYQDSLPVFFLVSRSFSFQFPEFLRRFNLTMYLSNINKRCTFL